MRKSVTSMEEIITGIKEGVRSANLPIRDTGEEQTLQREQKSSQSEQGLPPRA